MRTVVALSGRLCNGKSRVAKLLQARLSFALFDTSNYLNHLRDVGEVRKDLQALGDQLDRQTDFRWLSNEVTKLAGSLNDNIGIVIDHIRNAGQLKYLRSSVNWRLLHIHLRGDQTILVRRYNDRGLERRAGDISLSYEGADAVASDRDIDAFEKDADLLIDTSHIDEGDAYVMIGARLGVYAPPERRCVDVLVGGQYGSEGKGQVAAYLASEYDLLMRVGGPNAGHTVSSAGGVYTYHHLPSGCREATGKILIGPGSALDVESLLNEIDECGLTGDRLTIDGQAVVITAKDKEREAKLVSRIGSTGSGTGSASSNKILLRGDSEVRLARDIRELEPFIGSTLRELERSYSAGKSILLEGTQGSGLSLHHGEYPYVTSRDTNVSGCLSEAGISPSKVRRVIMVVRSFPIRVMSPAEGTSGNIKHECMWDDVAQKSGYPVEQLRGAEKTSTTRRQRRVGWFDWELFRRSCSLNAPTDIALTFSDYLGKANSNARRFEQLNQETLSFVEMLERVAHAPVSIINLRFPRTETDREDLRTIIDRRDWTGSLQS